MQQFLDNSNEEEGIKMAAVLTLTNILKYLQCK